MAIGQTRLGHPASNEPFIGRESELKQLDGWLVEASRKVPATVLVGGEAGVGKSRLLRQFVTTTVRASHGHVLWGACIALAAGTAPYTPLIEALRRLVRERGEQEVRRIGGPAYLELSNLISDVTVGPTGVPTSQLRIFGAVLRLLDHLGAKAPTVLIFEDLHWADPSTLDLVSYLTRAQTDERLLLICTYRSNDLDRRHPLWTLLAEPEFTRRIRRIEMSPFTESELRLFLTATSGERIDHRLAARFYELSEGNAFFAEELMVSGMLTDPANPRLPRTLSAVMLSRFELLSEEAAHVIRVAATAGRRVGHHLLAAVCGVSDQALDRALRECVAQHMLVIDPTDDTYVFRHALLREAVYQDLLPGERVRLHAKLAAALAGEAALGLAEDLTTAAELAHHWYAANVPPQALRTATHAGDLAARVGAYREAEQQYQRVLELWARVSAPEEITGRPRERVLAAAADAARWAGHVDRAVALVREAIGEVDPDRDPRRAGELHERLGSYLWEAGESNGSHQAYREANRLLAGEPPTAVTARVLAGLATAAVRAGQYSDGLREGAKAVELARSVDALAEEGRARNTMGVALTMLGRAGEGVENLRIALRIAADVDHLEDLVRAYGNLAVALEHDGQLTESVQVALDGLALARRRGLEQTRGGGVLANNAAATLVLLGRWSEAISIIEDVLPHRPIRESLYPRLTLAEIHVARGSFDAANDLLSAVRQAARHNDDPRFVGPLHACAAELAIWRGDLGAAHAEVSAGLAAVAGVENALVLLRLCAVGLRAAADECLRLGAMPVGERTGLAAAVERADGLLALVDRAIPEEPADPAEVTALWRLCRAERARAAGTETAAGWAEVAAAWSAIGQPYPSGYASWREADAAIAAGDAARARAAIRAAYATAEQLGALPLVAEIKATARRARVDLSAPPEAGKVTEPEAQPNPFRLTARELEVLRHLCAGRTNQQIAEALVISPSTASVHVSNILSKLQVGNRNAAAAKAHRLRLVAEPKEELAGRPAPADRPSSA